MNPETSDPTYKGVARSNPEPQQTLDIGPMLQYCLASVADVGPTFHQHRVLSRVCRVNAAANV